MTVMRLEGPERVLERASVAVPRPSPSEVLLEVDGELTRLPFGDIAVARLAPS